MIINVRVGSMGNRETFPVNTETTTPAMCFEKAGVDYTTAQPQLNGIALRAGEMGATLADLNITADAVLTVIVKADSAA